MALLPAETLIALAIVRCAGLLYGIDVKWVREIQPFTQVTPVYGLPAFWVGVMALRGQLYAVLDLAQVLSPQQTPAENRQHVVFTVVNRLAIGLLVEEMPAVCQIDTQTLTAVSPSSPSYITGTTSEQITVIDLPALFADPCLAVPASRTGNGKP
ncbi:MAG: chemotaxis protein CheW [Chloroflexi bacterium]|nr:chemotaxis protein CheW [Chloroflexota bacterium]